MTKDELIYKLKYIPGDIHILIHFNNNISNGFYEIVNKIKIFVGEKDYREIFVNNLIRTPNELIIDVDEQTNSTIYDTQPIIFL